MKNDYRQIDKDPIIDLMRTEVSRRYKLEGSKIPDHVLKKLADESGLTAGTYKRWFKGGTRRPQHLTVRFTLEALGLRYAVMRMDGSEVRSKK